MINRLLIAVMTPIVVLSCGCAKPTATTPSTVDTLNSEDSMAQCMMTTMDKSDNENSESLKLEIESKKIDYIGKPVFYLLSGELGEEKCERIEGAEVLLKKTLNENNDDFGLFLSCMEYLKDAPKKDCQFVPDMAVSFEAKSLYTKNGHDIVTISYSFYCDVFRVRCKGMEYDYCDTDADQCDREKLRRIMVETAYLAFPKDRYVLNMKRRLKK